MASWSVDQLERIGAADELRITATRSDGRASAAVPIWVVRVGDDVVVRSFRGADGAWFRHAIASGRADVFVGGMHVEVVVRAADEADAADVDEAYRAKYARYGRSYLDVMTGPRARAATARLTPA